MSNAFLTSDIHQPDTIHLIVLTGMSGGGKTVALRALEDLEFYCVDNLPTALLPELGAAGSHGAVAGKRQNIAVQNARTQAMAVETRKVPSRQGVEV